MVAIEYDIEGIKYCHTSHTYDNDVYKLDKPLYNIHTVRAYELLRPLDNIIFCLEGDEEKALTKLLYKALCMKEYYHKIVDVLIQELIK